MCEIFHRRIIKLPQLKLFYVQLPISWSANVSFITIMNFYAGSAPKRGSICGGVLANVFFAVCSMRFNPKLWLLLLPSCNAMFVSVTLKFVLNLTFLTNHNLFSTFSYSDIDNDILLMIFRVLVFINANSCFESIIACCNK